MEIIYRLFGEGKDLSITQMGLRAIVIYFLALVMIRISGRRTFGKKSSFDNTLTIIFGAILSRAVVGASPFVPIICSCFLLVLMHRLTAWACIRNDNISRLLKGERIMLFQNGQLDQAGLRKSLVSETDVMSDVRLKGNTDSLDEISQICMETNGEVSVVKRSKNA
jgi:uncharacterized membrane protein YcaP (DUF421 family)